MAAMRKLRDLGKTPMGPRSPSGEIERDLVAHVRVERLGELAPDDEAGIGRRPFQRLAHRRDRARRRRS